MEGRQPAGLELADDEFWSDSLAARADAAAADGLVLAAPASAALDQRQTLPVLIRRTGPVRDSIAAPMGRFALVHAVNLVTNELFTDLAVRPRDDPRPWTEPTPEQLQGISGRTSEPAVADLRDRLGLPWRPGELLVVATVRELRSNARRIALVAPREFGPQPGQPSRESSAHPSSRERSARSPSIPAEPGIALAAELAPAGQRDPAILHAAYRIRALPSDRKAGGVAVHLVFSGRLDPSPVPVRVLVPVPADGGEVATGYFSIGLAALGLAAAEQYQVFAISREAIGGPALTPPTAE
jgi:hypothetical protein